MNNEQENREPELKKPAVVTPPPFRQQEEDQAQEPTASPTLEERISALGLDDEAAGYLRGRNEKIEAVLHPEPDLPDESDTTPVFPHYNRRSIWDAV